MQFNDNATEAEYRQEVRSFIREHLPSDWVPPASPWEEQDDERKAMMKQWRTSLASRGWIAPHWPTEYGGAGMTVEEQFIFNEEMATARAPQVGGMGVQMIGPVLILHGTDEQKKEHLPKITSGEVQWCQGYSEPGSGSDLASLQTRATRDGDDYVINGSKIWTSGAQNADWMFMLARTDPDAPKHRGISMFLMDMKSPGISVQPLITMAGDHVFNQEYFEDVRVPARNMVGEENRGWYVGATLLDFERSNISASIHMVHQVRDLATFVRESRSNGTPIADDPGIRTEIAERAVEAEIAKLISYQVVSIQKRGEIPNREASMNKLYRSEANQRLAQTSMKVIGMYGNLYTGSPRALLDGRFAHGYISAVSGTIAAGTSEINRNVIATRGLGLPRS